MESITLSNASATVLAKFQYLSREDFTRVGGEHLAQVMAGLQALIDLPMDTSETADTSVGMIESDVTDVETPSRSNKITSPPPAPVKVQKTSHNESESDVCIALLCNHGVARRCTAKSKANGVCGRHKKQTHGTIYAPAEHVANWEPVQHSDGNVVMKDLTSTLADVSVDTVPTSDTVEKSIKMKLTKTKVDPVILTPTELPDIVKSVLESNEEEADKMTRAPGVFAQACAQHVGLTNHNYVFEATITEGKAETTFAEALARWIEGEDVALVSELPPDSTSTCPPTSGALD